MADRNLELALRIKNTVEGAEDVDALKETLDSLTAKVLNMQDAAAEGGKDWLDYTQQLAGVAESMTNVVSTSEDIAKKTVEIGAAIYVYQKWRTLVEGVQTAYGALQGAIAAAAAAGADTAGSAWSVVNTQTLKLETNIGSLAARFASLEVLAKGLSLAGLALGLAKIGEQAHDSNEQTRQLIEQIGGLSAPLQQLDPASKPVQLARERFEELYKASLALHEEAPALVEQYKKFFDATASGNLTVQQSSRLLTDINQVQKSLRSSAAETEIAQKSLNEAFESGITSIPQLSSIFGAALNPALDAVSQSMGITRDQLTALINSGQVGAETVLPALAAAARNVTAPINDTASAAEFSKEQFKAMGETFYSLSGKTLPGVATALQYTAKEIANTADASVDPIGAAVEQIENFGMRIAEWARLTKQSITDAFSGPDLKAALDTGLKEAMYGLDYLLVGIKEEFTAVGESIGIVAGAAVTATNPIDDLKAVWSGMGDRLLNTRDRLNEYINALEGVDNAASRTAEGAQQLAASLQTVPEVKLPETLQEIIDNLDETATASTAVQAVWKELAGLDFTGDSIKNLLILRQSIQEVSTATNDATGTQAAFAVELAKLPVEKLVALTDKVVELAPRLKQAGDDGALMQTVLGAAFEKLGLNAAEAAGKITQSGQAAAEVFGLLARQADVSGAQIRAALEKALDAAKTQADVALIDAEFQKLAKSGQASGQLIADGHAAITKRLGEIQEQLPGLGGAFKTLGESSAAHLRTLADNAAAAFKQLQEGNISVRELQKGFLAWAEAEIKAANAAGLPIPAVLKHQAAALGLNDALADLIRRYREITPEQAAHLKAAERTAESARNLTGALQAVANAQLDGIRADRDKATALGANAIAQQKSVELAKAEAQWAQLVAAAKQIEIAAEQALLQAKIEILKSGGLKTQADQQEYAGLQLKNAALGLESDAVKKSAEAKDIAARQAGLTTQATQQETTATDQNTDAQEKSSKAKKAGASVAKIMADALNYAREQTKALSDATGVLFEKLYNKRAGAEGIADTGLQKYIIALEQAPPKFAAVTQKIGQLNAAIAEGEKQYLFASNSVGRFLANLQISSAQAQKAWYEQKLQADILIDSLQNLGTSGAQNMALIAQATRAAEGDLAMLDEEDLSGLRSALDDAKKKLQDLQQEAESARDSISELNAEIAREKGDTATADRLALELERQQKLKEAQANLAKAEAQGNRDLITLYQEQIGKLQTLYDLKEKNLKRDQEEARSSSNRTETTTHTTVSSGSNGISGGNNVTINLPNAITADRAAIEDLTRRHILPVLKDIERRSR